MEGLGGTRASHNFGSQSLKVLLVGRGDKPCQSLVVFDGVERLAPHHVRSFRVRLQFEGEHEVMAVEVLDLEELVWDDAREAALVGVVLTVCLLYTSDAADE